MTIVIRGIAVLTVLLGLAVMAVSTYAAKEEQERSATGAGAGAEGTATGASTEEAAAGQAESPATATAEAQPTPTPTIVVHFAAPVGAASATGGRSSRGNLSSWPRTWRVPSLKPLPAILTGLGLDIPPDQLAVMQQVSLRTGVPWQILAAIARVESDFGRNMATSWAGAIGYGQFLPEMWAIYGSGGDAYDFRDVLPAMGRYLVVAGAPGDIVGAIFAYNHSWSYVGQVLQVAASYGYPDPSAARLGTFTRDLIWPVFGPLSSYFTPEHQGIDIDQTAAPGTPVRAAHDGVVLFAGGDPCCSYGRYVILVGPSGIMTLYAHLDSLAVSDGQTVRQEQSLGPVGCTGLCTGVHLHFEVIEDGTRRNPLDYLP